ncbi:MAG: DUF362 domain-containing protein [Bacteroidota bacterium]|nr:DUF362 domain-containing protein [Bacteroidota bacterium]
MSGFVNISTLFSGSEERTVERLSGIYKDMEKLVHVIEKSIEGRLDRDLIKDKRVLLKPNWVKHSRNESDEICLRTHDNFILATIRILLEMGPASIFIADAPIQGCCWDRMISAKFLKEISSLSGEYKIPVQLKDFRRRTYSFTENKTETGIRPLSDYNIVDLGEKSLLEAITLPGPSQFRVTDYDPDRMATAHAPGVHKYCIAKDYFDADVVISLPKLKTHQKTGITGALKNLVGINGDKDFLPHHRIGGTKMGGDCYPGRSFLRYRAELLLDAANRRQGKKSFWLWQKFSALLWRSSLPGPEHQVAAGWYGNDTTWRMVMDLNRIAQYCDASGNMSDTPQRQLFSLCDGIIGGQGDGPLEPDPLPLGIVSFTNNSLLNDRVIAKLMGFPLDKMPLLNHHPEDQDTEIVFNGELMSLVDLKQYAINTVPPRGWIRFFEKSDPSE